ncbi:nucleotidyltransferase domain-containing protein [Spirosoma aerolatum]|uniref:nucleotidyltransferase domain-containing protein n=1 Tax=Spirosoma aerolatum TaxID=1211326 RepID=UPI0009ACEDCE|nr:nucleotidyltransferase domain-containing protein [Spirosoma aerolatum]
MTDRQFLQAVKRYVHDIDPKAEVWLFGSRARKDARSDSDWDFLVLTDNVVDQSFKRRMRDNLFYLELDSERVIETVIQNKAAWQNLELTSRYQNIKQDGRIL